jgi:hypothetical protein
MLTDYSKAYKVQSDPTLNNLWGDAFTTSTPLDMNSLKGNAGLTFNSGTGVQPRGVSPVSASSGGSVIFASKYAAGATGGQCGDFARKLVTSYGYDYPRLGDGKTDKANAVQKYGVPSNQWNVGTVLVTAENPTYGHVAVINGFTDKGIRVTESNYNQNGKVSHTRIIPYSSNKIIGGINPYKKTQTA